MTPTRSTSDVVVIGAGIVGLSVAHQIRRRSALSVTVVDKAANVAEGSTGASSAILRHRYSHDETIRFARDGIRAYHQWEAFTGLAEPRMQPRRTGVMWMLGDSARQVEEWVARLASLDIPAVHMTGTDIREAFPGVSTCSAAFDLTGEIEHVCAGAESFLFEPGGGYADPVSAAQDLAEAITAGGADVRFRTPVTSIITRGGRASGVSLADGSTIDASIVVLAAGPWTPQLLAAAGIDSPWDLVPTRVQVVYRAGGFEGRLPVLADSSTGIYLRPEGQGQILFGSVLEEDEREEADPDDFVSGVDATFRDRLIHALHHRLPGLEHRGDLSGVAGIYTVNRDDVHPIIGPVGVDGLHIAAGFSGHGFKEAPAAGALIARLVTGEVDEFDTDAPLDFFSIDREPIQLDDKAVLA